MDEAFGYTIDEARKRLGGMCRTSLYRAVHRKELELVKVGGRSIITARSLNALLNGKSQLQAVA